jgi:hypothetical protein
MIAGIVASAVLSVAITDDFDTDFGVNEWHGTNAFIRDGDRVFRKGNRVHVQRKMVLRTSHHFGFARISKTTTTGNGTANCGRGSFSLLLLWMVLCWLKTILAGL